MLRNKNTISFSNFILQFFQFFLLFIISFASLFKLVRLLSKLCHHSIFFRDETHLLMFKIHKNLFEFTDALMQIVSRTIHASNLARHILDLLVEFFPAFIFCL
jgi:hypothetical protein